MSNQTIVAQATPIGRGSVGIIRISGKQAKFVAQQVLGRIPRPRYAEYLAFLDEQGNPLDQGIALYFPAPHSFTGEDILELQGHGGAVLQDMLLKRILQIPSIRIARPGEFSERAFLNDKMDLTQAEAIADLIDATSEQAARSALSSLQGAFSLRIQQLLTELTQLRIYVEAAIDFPDEEIDFLSDGKVEQDLKKIAQTLQEVQQQAKQGSLLREGIKVVIAGRPNVGKSSLLNALAGRDAAIVTAIAGTTRDVLREHIHLDGIPLHIIDTAGLRDTGDEVEQIGIARAWQEIQHADLILFMQDSLQDHEILPEKIWPEFHAKLPKHIPLTIIRNKIDLSAESPSLEQHDTVTVIKLSAQTGMGMELLSKHLKQSMGWNSTSEGGFLARRRHLTALSNATQHIDLALQQLIQYQAGELVAEELRYAQQELSEITGEFTSDDLLGEIFSHFCIGK